MLLSLIKGRNILSAHIFLVRLWTLTMLWNGAGGVARCVCKCFEGVFAGNFHHRQIKRCSQSIMWSAPYSFTFEVNSAWHANKMKRIPISYGWSAWLYRFQHSRTPTMNHDDDDFCLRSLHFAGSINSYLLWPIYNVPAQPPATATGSTFPQSKIFRWMAYNLRIFCETWLPNLQWRRTRARGGAQEGMIQFGQITSNLPNEYYTHKRIIVLRSGRVFASLTRLFRSARWACACIASLIAYTLCACIKWCRMRHGRASRASRADALRDKILAS